MNEVVARRLPEHSLLLAYHSIGDYTDCFTMDVAGDISLQRFATAFYTSRLFKRERFILKWLMGKPSSDRDVDRMAAGSVDRFAAWTVERRTPDQLLLCDYQGRTRSWLMVEPITAGADAGTRLSFGTGVVSVRDRRTGRKSMPLPFRLLLGFHLRYAKALLRSAIVKLQADQRESPAHRAP